MRFHKEGRIIISISILICVVLIVINYLTLPSFIWASLLISVFIMVLVLQFFRNPLRVVDEKFNNHIIAPADGKVVTIERVTDNEGIEGEWTQISIFMSPINVHVNRNPCSGIIRYYAYHEGKYLVAWHPKSSTQNERTTIIYETSHGFLKMRQIAGAVARRIVCYAVEGQEVKQGDDIGFIKFGSRVDLLLPKNVKLNVSIDDDVKGNMTSIAEWIS